MTFMKTLICFFFHAKFWVCFPAGDPYSVGEPHSAERDIMHCTKCDRTWVEGD
jgi:hypothetical protein